jgi:adenylate cyclase
LEIQRIIRYALSLALTLAFLLHVGEIINIPILSNLENQAYDFRLKISLPEHVDKQVVIIGIDEKSLEQIGQWPWNRNILQKINDTLFDYYQIRAIGYDIVFAEEDIDEGTKLLDKMASGSLKDDPYFIAEYKRVIPSLQHDQHFSQSLKNRNTVMGFIMTDDTHKGQLPTAVTELDDRTLEKLAILKRTGFTANLKILQNNALSGGFFDNPLLDADGVFRRVPLLQTYGNQLHQSLALALTRVALGSPPIKMIIKADESTDELYLEWLNIGEISIPVDQHSGILIPYIGPKESFEYLSAVDILNKKVEKDKLKGKIALFGASAPGLLDMRTTPLETAFPGVEVHANIVQGILDGRIQHAPGYTKGYEFLLILVIGLLLTFVLPRLSALFSILLISGSIVLLIATNFYAWNSDQMVLPIASPVLLVILLFTLQMTYGFFFESYDKRRHHERGQ